MTASMSCFIFRCSHYQGAAFYRGEWFRSCTRTRAGGAGLGLGLGARGSGYTRPQVWVGVLYGFSLPISSAILWSRPEGKFKVTRCMIRIAEQNQESTRDLAAALDVCSHRERYPVVPAASEDSTVSRHANCFHS